jgi:hypothetical protein
MSIDKDAFEIKRMMRLEAHEKAYEIEVKAQRAMEAKRDEEV